MQSISSIDFTELNLFGKWLKLLFEIKSNKTIRQWIYSQTKAIDKLSVFFSKCDYKTFGFHRCEFLACGDIFDRVKKQPYWEKNCYEMDSHQVINQVIWKYDVPVTIRKSWTHEIDTKFTRCKTESEDFSTFIVVKTRFFTDYVCVWGRSG